MKPGDEFVWEDDPQDRSPLTEAIDVSARMQSRIAELEAELAELKDWKHQALAVESEWDAQAVGKLLKIEIGQSIRKNIQPRIEALLAENERLRKALLNISGAYENPCLTDISDLYNIAKAALKEVDGGKD